VGEKIIINFESRISIGEIAVSNELILIDTSRNEEEL